MPKLEPQEMDEGMVSNPDSPELYDSLSIEDGRVSLNLSNASNEFHTQIGDLASKFLRKPSHSRPSSQYTSQDHGSNVPKLNIVIQIVGSRGDVQPFIALGKVLQAPPYGHRVRIATHAEFQGFVETHGLEFFNLGGNVKALMTYMVQNPNIVPRRKCLTNGDISKRRAEIASILERTWKSCIEPGDESDDPSRKSAAKEPFIADAIIANPPSYGHIHCAEKLSIPLHLMFTMPWSPTQAFPHPLANIRGHNTNLGLCNLASYSAAELLIWSGLGDVFNDFRQRTLGLQPINMFWGGNVITQLRVPWTYCWSKALIPQPKDWDSHIFISGFCFLEQPSSYSPPDGLIAFLNAESQPVYIGFGSIPLETPMETLQLILEAVRKAGVRAVISLGSTSLIDHQLPPEVYLIGDVPHDWLFPRVSCVVHHGGAGTTAIGMKLGKPTVIIPFFGDQHFWGAMIHRAGAGPKPMRLKKLTAENLAQSITLALSPETLAKSTELASTIEREDGAGVGAKQFHDALDIESFRCSILTDRAAVWEVRGSLHRLCPLAAAVLLDQRVLSLNKLQLLKRREWHTGRGPQTVLDGILATLTASVVDVVMRFRESYSKADNAPDVNSLECLLPEEYPDSDVHDQYLDRVQAIFLSGQNDEPPRYEEVCHTPSEKTPCVIPTHESATNPRLHADNKPRNSENLGRSIVLEESSASPVEGTASLQASVSEASEYASSEIHSEDWLKVSRACGAAFVKLGLEFPVDLVFNIAVGFHNSPSLLFGDKTVREPPRITGLKTGAMAAGSGLAFGLYDSITGIYEHPVNGYRENGPLGLVAGSYCAVGGVVVKPIAGVVGLGAYLLKGVQAEIAALRWNRDSPVLTLRRQQGASEMRTCSPDLTEEIVTRWEELHNIRGAS